MAINLRQTSKQTMIVGEIINGPCTSRHVSVRADDVNIRSIPNRKRTTLPNWGLLKLPDDVGMLQFGHIEAANIHESVTESVHVVVSSAGSQRFPDILSRRSNYLTTDPSLPDLSYARTITESYCCSVVQHSLLIPRTVSYMIRQYFRQYKLTVVTKYINVYCRRRRMYNAIYK